MPSRISGRISGRGAPSVAVAAVVLVGIAVVHWLATVFVSTPRVGVAGDPAGLPSWETWPIQLAALTVLSSAGAGADRRRVPRPVVTFLVAWAVGLLVLLANGYSRDVILQVLGVVLEPLPYVTAYLLILAGRPAPAPATDGADGSAPGRLARLMGRLALPVFLWHPTAPVIVALATTRLGPIPGLNALATPSAWLPARLAWLPLLAAMLAVLVALSAGLRPARD
ncbi:hypothetical protein HCN51_36950 [Nonomuraea sp. FMUSA5-5]|uniref:Uncharacterized protein n=1 Tax=Nonomuraea composti TaxID=2720023 RepID=A0ABX1BF24_9ACTN|nr:hypothetical protein [Nonomuraea sp. FMUSA5-5]NJP94962.1 hypothetical protein [Nonomuraea sp. FMUSA5-5]